MANKKLKWVYNKTRKQWRCDYDGIIVIIHKMSKPDDEYRMCWHIAKEYKYDSFDYADYEWAYKKLSSAKQAAWLRFFG